MQAWWSYVGLADSALRGSRIWKTIGDRPGLTSLAALYLGIFEYGSFLNRNSVWKQGTGRLGMKRATNQDRRISRATPTGDSVGATSNPQ